MQILKHLHRKGLIDSIRGAAGGYRLAVNLSRLSVYELIDLVDGVEETSEAETAGSGQPMEAPIRALRSRLTGFLKQVSVHDLIQPGRRIDVPSDALCNRNHQRKTRMDAGLLVTV